jgi:hydroxymethylglutaryl-CoA synthase
MTLNGAHPNPIQNDLMRSDRGVGLVGYGAYVPRYRLPGAEVARIWTNNLSGSPIKEKAVAGLDEDHVD